MRDIGACKLYVTVLKKVLVLQKSLFTTRIILEKLTEHSISKNNMVDTTIVVLWSHLFNSNTYKCLVFPKYTHQQASKPNKRDSSYTIKRIDTMTRLIV